MEDKILVLVENFSKRFLEWVFTVKGKIELTGRMVTPSSYFSSHDINARRKFIFLVNQDRDDDVTFL
jgi:hypothetical protein